MSDSLCSFLFASHWFEVHRAPEVLQDDIFRSHSHQITLKYLSCQYKLIYCAQKEFTCVHKVEKYNPLRI